MLAFRSLTESMIWEVQRARPLGPIVLVRTRFMDLEG